MPVLHIVNEKLIDFNLFFLHLNNECLLELRHMGCPKSYTFVGLIKSELHGRTSFLRICVTVFT